MKKLQVTIAGLLILGVFAFFVSPALAALEPIPLPRTPFNQREKFDTDLFSGSATYSYPLKVPKGTDDLTPYVSFSYSSSGVRDLKTYAGIGWQLNVDYVERDINYTPGSTSDDKFKLHFKGAVYDLVYVSGDGRYHTKIESNLNIQKLTGGSGAYTDYWQVITPDGTKYRFGYGTNSELTCADNPDDSNDNRSYVSSWNLDLVTDIHDNKIYYTYLENNGISYLREIHYNNDQTRHIYFNYGTNPYEHPVYNQGCYAYDLKRLTNIEIFIGTNLVRAYEMAYGQTGNTQPVLDSLIEQGNDWSSLPATTFYYKPEIHTWATSPQTWIDNADIDVHLQLANVVMADANGDGLLDIVKSEGTSTNTWKVWKNTGTSWNTTAEIWVNNVNMGATLVGVDARLIDVTGDGLPDIVKSEAGNVGGKSYWYVWRNTGSSWSTTQETWVNNDFVDAYFAQTDVKLMDVNGDGLADIVKTSHDNNSTWFVYKNTGSNSWSTTKETWLQASINAHLEDQNVRLVDVNGDGLPDIVKTVYSGGTWSTWYVYKNTGNSWGSQAMWLDADVDAHFIKTDVTLADANGDGLLDIVKSEELGSADRWKVLYNRGGSWTATWETWIDPSSNVDLSLQGNTQMADINGDGLADIIKTDPNGGRDTWKVWKNNGVSPHLIASIHNPQGGVISFDYLKAAGYDNTGSDDIADLPFPLWVVGTMTVNNGLSNTQETEDVTTYSYKDGFYKAQDHEFRGFGTVNTVEPNGSKKQYVFNQDDALKGRLAEIQHRDSSNNPYTETEDTWSNSSSNGVYTVNLTQEKNYTYDGNASSPKVTQNDYTYDSYGNVTKKSEQGDTGVSGDERFTYNEYVYDTSDWIVNTAKHTYRNKENDSTKISESWFYYDGHSGNSDTPTKGDLTKKVDWLSGGTNPETTYAYDSYGNQTSVTDANSHTTSTAYDSATHTYPTSITNAKSQTTYVGYDLGTGNFLYKNDPNNDSIDYYYDAFGRLIKEVKPYDSSTNPTVKYQYFTSGVDGILTSRREASGSSSATLDTYTWVDGLGRTVQTRSEMEDPTKQTVVNTYYDATGQIAKVSVPHQAGNTDYYVNPETGIKSTDTSYDPIGRVSIVTNTKGDTKTIAYDHWKATTIDENGHIKRQYFNAFGKITKVDEVLSGSTIATNYEYDALDNLTKIIDAPTNETTFTYDTLGRKTSQVDPDMGTWTYGYDGVGNLTSQTDNRSVTITKTYDQLNRLTKTDYPNDTDSTFLYDAYGKIGTLTIATDSAGMVTYLYDNRLRKTQEQRKVNGTTKTTGFSYDAADRTVTQTNPDGETVTYAYNIQGEVDSVTGSSTILSNINYNALGKVTSKAYANSLTTNYTYNTNDFRLNRIQTGSLQDMNYTYDNVGNVAAINDAVLSKTQNFSYDDLDRLKTASESASGYNYAYTYNSIGNLTAFNSSGSATNYTYGENSKVHALTSSTEVVSPQVVNNTGTPLTSTVTDNWSTGSIDSSKWMNWGGSQVSIVNQELAMSSTLGAGYYGVDSGINGKTYNLTNSSIVNKVVDAGNQSLGTWEVYPIYAYVNGDSSNQYFFFIGEGNIRAYKKVNGSADWLASTPYNATNHKWVRIREASGTTYFETSANGVTWNSFASVANPFTVTSMVIGSEVGTWSSEGSTTTAIFDNFNYVAPATSTLTDDWSSGTISSSRWSDWSGGQGSVSSEQLNLTSTTGGGYYGLDSGSNVYNLTNSSIVTKLVNAGNLSLGSWEVYPIYAMTSGDSSTQYFFYLGDGSKLRAYKKVSGSNTILAETTYNATNHKWFRIRESGGTTYFDTSADGAAWSNFASTANAFNLTNLVVGTEVGSWNSEASTTTAIFDNFNVWTPVYTYDANGNMTSDGKYCYEFNEANQMSKVKECGNSQTISEYVYDYNGLRMVKKNYQHGSLKDTVTSWSDSFETKVIVGGATENTAYYFVNSELIAKKDNSGTKTYYHNDHLGSATLLTNSGGTLVEDTKFDPWGEVKSGGTKSKFLYTGQEKDLETGLNYYNARYYDSHIRRFTQPDDIIQDPYNPQSLNRYSYVWNNPLKYTDPTGHYVETALDVAFLAMDVNEIRQDPTNLWNWAALGGDAVGTVTPGLTGVGLGMRLIEHGGDAGKVMASYTKTTQQTGKTTQNVVKDTSLNKSSQQGGGVKQWISNNIQWKGHELVLGGGKLRIAPYGNPNAKPKLSGSTNWASKLPHIHYSKKDASGKSLPGEGARRHRPWETLSLFKRWFK